MTFTDTVAEAERRRELALELSHESALQRFTDVLFPDTSLDAFGAIAPAVMHRTGMPHLIPLVSAATARGAHIDAPSRMKAMNRFGVQELRDVKAAQPRFLHLIASVDARAGESGGRIEATA